MDALDHESFVEMMAQQLWGCTWEDAQKQGYTQKDLIAAMPRLGLAVPSEDDYNNNYEFFDGWWIVALDKTKESYEEIPSHFDGVPVVWMQFTFANCNLLKTSPAIPNTVTNMDGTFKNCTSLETAPDIPSSVINMEDAFSGCTALTGVVTINANPTTYTRCFKNIDMTNITLTGSASKDILNQIGATGDNWTHIE